MIVVDASVLVTALIDEGEAGGRVRGRLRPEELAAPELIDLEVLSALRGWARGDALPERRADAARAALLLLPLQRVTHAGLLARVWSFRHDLTTYDAAYVALAEALGCPLVTADRRIAAAPGLRCPIELL